MAVPKRKTSPGRRGRRRAHQALSPVALSVDQKTKSVHRPHHVDLRTGFYRGQQVLFPEPVDDENGAEGDGDTSTSSTSKE